MIAQNGNQFLLCDKLCFLSPAFAEPEVNCCTDQGMLDIVGKAIAIEKIGLFSWSQPFQSCIQFLHLFFVRSVSACADPSLFKGLFHSAFRFRQMSAVVVSAFSCVGSDLRIQKLQFLCVRFQYVEGCESRCVEYHGTSVVQLEQFAVPGGVLAPL